MKKTLNFIKLFFLFYYYKLIYNFNKKKGINEKSEFVISLTSFNKRIKYLHLVIESLFRQHHKPKKIYLWLSSEDIKNKDDLKKLRKLESRGLSIKIINENIKSYKKLIYTYDEIIKNGYNINYIITADDDVFYPPYWSQKLINKSKEELCVSCYRGHNLKYINNSFNYEYSMNNNTSLNNPSWSLLPTGCSGVCYPINSLSDFLMDYKFLELSPNGDDIWFKAVTLSNGFKSCRIEKDNIHFPPLITSFGSGLYEENVKQGMNDSKLNNTFEYFISNKKIKNLSYFE
ncbi:hypothetical protein AB7X34_19950 [Proteus mirabilis]|uniref:hypothetical protein n=1 Tax=Proteus mirabilis TaxID=584 RepID=UPI0025A70316|nr:hypothetical protein [Proteus mirabilis]EKW1742768.1 hypothetical protein [Proteus mirabilis]WOT30909.1 hypothetical protein R3372_00410 [Proteus mirabilis]HEI8459163.1 hypothetical protein [Proteus mirabilis]HEK1169573.1 hypothetical protein [Proteus mirabilis]